MSGVDWQPAWWDRRKAQNKRSKRQETSIAKEVGGRVQPGSGSSRRAPQDVKQKLIDEEGDLLQIKYTDKDSVSFKGSYLDQIFRDSILNGREPGMVVELSKHKLRLKIQIERIK